MHMHVYRNQVRKVFLHPFVVSLSAPPNQYHIFWTQFYSLGSTRPINVMGFLG